MSENKKIKLEKDLQELIDTLQAELWAMNDGLRAMMYSCFDGELFEGSNQEEAERALKWAQSYYGLVMALLREYDAKIDIMAHRLDDFTATRCIRQ